MDDKLLDTILKKKEKLDSFRPLPPSLAEKLRDQFIVEWTYNSNAIEGNTLSLKETEVVLHHGVTIGGKSLREHFEAVNHKEGIEFLEKIIAEKQNISEEIIRKLHGIILRNIDDKEAGAYRRYNVRIMGASFLPPRAEKVKPLMKDLLQWYNTGKHDYTVPVLAAQMHYRLVHIHPFIDGNGRLSRLLMNLILMAAGYPPAVILNSDRAEYYRVLSTADSGDTEPFEDFTGRAIIRSLELYLYSFGG